jgi:hypothetical protein
MVISIDPRAPDHLRCRGFSLSASLAFYTTHRKWVGPAATLQSLLPAFCRSKVPHHRQPKDSKGKAAKASLSLSLSFLFLSFLWFYLGITCPLTDILLFLYISCFFFCCANSVQHSSGKGEKRRRRIVKKIQAACINQRVANCPRRCRRRRFFFKEFFVFFCGWLTLVAWRQKGHELNDALFKKIK